MNVKVGDVVTLKEGNGMWVGTPKAVVFHVEEDLTLPIGVVKLYEKGDSQRGMMGWVKPEAISEPVYREWDVPVTGVSVCVSARSPEEAVKEAGPIMEGLGDQAARDNIGFGYVGFGQPEECEH